MNLEEALELPFEEYLQWCREFVNRKIETNPITQIIMSYPYSWTSFEASWAKRYWFHKCGVKGA